jgi:Family of unknown function (DUF6812)
MCARSVKERIRVVILTATYRIEGEVHISPGGRVLDEVNKDKPFLPLTKAAVYSITGNKPLTLRDFLAVNKSSIVMISPRPEKEAAD